MEVHISESRRAIKIGIGNGYQAIRQNGLTFSSPAYKQTFNVIFDGKSYTDSDQDPAAEKGATTTTKRMDAHTFEIVGMVNGKLDKTTEYKLSEDGKTMTTIFKAAKSSAVFTNVYDQTSLVEQSKNAGNRYINAVEL